MNFKQASLFRVPFGPNKGKTIDEVAKTDEGLISLDRFVGWLEDHGMKDSLLYEALTTYLKDEAVQRDLRNATEGHTW